MKKRIIQILVATIAATGGGLAFSGTAQAKEECPTGTEANHMSGQVCFYENFDFTGSFADEPLLNGTGTGQATGIIYNFQNSHFANGDTLNDNISSIVNNTNNSVRIYQDFKLSGRSIIISPHSQVNLRFTYPVDDPSHPDISFQEDFNDAASSARLG